MCCTASIQTKFFIWLILYSISSFIFFPCILNGFCVLKRLFLHLIGMNSISHVALQEGELQTITLLAAFREAMQLWKCVLTFQIENLNSLLKWPWEAFYISLHRRDVQDESSRVQKANQSAANPVPRDTEVSSLLLAAANSSEEVTGPSCFPAYQRSLPCQICWHHSSTNCLPI